MSDEADAPRQRAEAIRHIMATIFSAQNALRCLAPEFRWAGMGNLLGDYGEFIAVSHYDLKKADAVSAGYDAITKEGKTVQVKTSHSANQIGFRGKADLMLVIKVGLEGTWDEVYFGDFASVRAIARYSARDNKHMVPLSKLQSLKRTSGQLPPDA